MASLVDYLSGLPELTGGVHAKPPAQQPDKPYVIWEEGPESARRPIFDPDGRQVAVWARTVSVFLYVPDTAGYGRSYAARLNLKLANAVNEVNDWPELPFLALLPGSDMSPTWNGDRWVSVVRYTLLYIRN